jgi:hypothetical protein
MMGRKELAFFAATSTLESAPSWPSWILSLLTPLILLCRIQPYMESTKEAAGIRSKLFNTEGARWLGFWTTEMGGNLNRVHHLVIYSPIIPLLLSHS